MKILKIIFDIFLDEQISNSKAFPKGWSDIEHYKKEIDLVYLDEVYIITSYESIKGTLEAFKYRSEIEKSQELVEYFGTSPLFSLPIHHDEWTIVSVPMHWIKYIFRAYDHMGVIAKKLSKITGISSSQPIATKFNWWKQAKLSKTERIKNRKGVFFIKKHAQFTKNIILIDDVISTGSTVNECAKVLKEGGVEKVYGIFLASNRDESILPY